MTDYVEMPIQLILELINRAHEDKLQTETILKEIESVSLRLNCYTRDILDR
jgi:hypothetical protein